MKYVIIGASAAGAQSAEELRRLDKEAQITVITSENHLPYSRCLISRFVDGRLTEDNLYFKSKKFFNNNNIEARLGVEITKIDKNAKKVISKNNEEFTYDKLLNATGSSPWSPKIDGSNLDGVYSFHSMDNASDIIKRMDKIENAVVIGAGFVGLEAAYALARCGIKVTVVEKASQILPNQMDVTGSQIIQRDLEEMGVQIILDESILSINGDNAVQSVTVADKTQIPCGLVIIATGMRPNIGLAVNSEIKTGRGIVVDEFLRTSEPDIYAAGDVIEIDDISTGRRITSATWFNAVLQGKFAARNMAGLEARYSHGIGIQNAVQFHQIPAISFVKTQLNEEDEQDYDVVSIHKDKVYKKLILKDNKLCGMIFVGDISKSGFYTALIRYGIDISKYKSKLLDSDFSYAYFRDENFSQYSPYTESNAVWEQPDWWAKRVQYIEG
ncbi:MAG: NAD(P)/FAD-dependent oxidoreductase [Candidatus Poribacteria bacterium]|nr:NAD(P)/FAD-dependent oxidoreductase [Candidatus Poribacteria bacterium]